MSEVYLDQMCGVLGVNVGELPSRRRKPRLRELQEFMTVVGVEEFGPRVREIPELLQKNPRGVSLRVMNAAERR